jgi:hypothetical protein
MSNLASYTYFPFFIWYRSLISQSFITTLYKLVMLENKERINTQVDGRRHATKWRSIRIPTDVDQFWTRVYMVRGLFHSQKKNDGCLLIYLFS